MRASLLIALAGFLCSSLFFINLCNLVFRCGCQSLWDGAAEHCNIHNATGKHCPVCAQGPAGQAAMYLAMIGPQFFAAWRLRKTSVWTRLLLVLALMPLGGGTAMALLGWTSGYWK